MPRTAWTILYFTAEPQPWAAHRMCLEMLRSVGIVRVHLMGNVRERGTSHTCAGLHVPKIDKLHESPIVNLPVPNDKPWATAGWVSGH